MTASTDDNLVLAEQVAAAYAGKPGGIPTTVYANLIAAVVLVFAMSDVVPALALGGWLAAQVAYQLARVYFFRAYTQSQPSPADAPRWAKLFALQTTTNGVIWGMAGGVLFPADSLAHQAILAIVLSGMAAGSITVTAMLLPAFLGSAGSILGIFAARLLFVGDETHVTLGFLVLAYLLFILGWGKSLNQLIVRSIQQRFENLNLVRQLQEQTAVAEEAKEVAVQANQAKSRFLAAASHDLRQPLHAMTLFSQAMVEREDPREMRELARHIDSSVLAMNTLFNSLLDLSKLDAGVIEPKLKSFAVQPIFDKLRNDFTPTAAAKGLRLRVRDTDAVAHTDPLLLEQILRNLIANAIRYTNAGGVLLACRQRDGMLSIEVRDTGIGIPEDQQGAIFGEYVQLGNSERDRQKGLGLGLSIVQRLTTLLDMPLRLQSKPAVGTLFAVEVPVGEMPAVVPEQTISGLLDFNGLRVLAIDDEDDILTALSALLGGWGCEVVTAESFLDAETELRVRDFVPQVAISDLRLRDGQDGIDALHALEAQCPGLQCLLVTGDIEAKQLQRVKDSGYYVMHKPIAPAKLRVALRNFAAELSEEPSL
jgi:signal transduction histidine kinase/ActR/RegA family two-component response regulator